MLIVFEGIDGSGKHTQIALLLAYLRQHKIRHKLHKFPTRKASEVFEHLSGKKEVAPERLADVFARDIAVEGKEIEGEMKEGFAVVCDRYLHSTLAYQGAALGYEKLKGNLEGKKVPVPDVVVLLDLPAERSLARKQGQKEPDRFEKDREFLSAVRENYLRMARGLFLSYKYVVVDARKTPEEVFSEVIMQLEPFLTKKK